MDSKLGLIVKREFNAKVRNKSFIIMTVLAPFLMAGMGFLIIFLGKANDSKIKTIAFVDEAKLFSQNAFEDTKSVKYIDLTSIGVDKAKKIAEEKKYYGLLTIPKQDSLELLAQDISFYSKKTPNTETVNSLEKKIESNIKNQKLHRLGIDLAKIKSAKISTDIKLTNYSGEETSKFMNSVKVGIGSFAGYMIMMFVMVFGTSVMRSVIEEKTSRIIEVIISSIKPFQLMMGKIIGNALAGLTQFAIWGILIIIFGIVATTVFGINFGEMQTANPQPEQMEMVKEMMADGKIQNVITELSNQLPWTSILVYFILYFLGGYLLYSSIYAAIGAAVDSETDTQQFMPIVMMPLVLAVYVGLVAVMKDPHGPIAVAFSIIPLTSPIVMLMRIPFGVPIIQIVVSLVLLILNFLLFVWLAAKIYRVGILMYGKKPSYKEIYKWMRYKS